MGWSIGYDTHWKRDIGYGVPAICDHPGCNEEIDRGLGCVCGGEPYGGDHGCGLYFCGHHLSYAERGDDTPQLCERCQENKDPFEPKPDTQEWIDWKETDESWAQWRKERDAVAANNHSESYSSGESKSAGQAQFSEFLKQPNQKDTQ